MTKDEAIDLIDNLLQTYFDYENATDAKVKKARAEYATARMKVIVALTQDKRGAP